MTVATLVHAESGAMPRLVMSLSALGGFTAGALVIGMVALSWQPAGEAAGTQPIPARDQAPALEWRAAYNAPSTPAAVAAPEAWHFETAAPQLPGGPGRNRPDRLSGPEGWTPSL